MQQRPGRREAILVRGLIRLLSWVLERFLPDPSIADLEQGDGGLLAEAQDQFMEVIAAAFGASPVAPTRVAPPSTPPASVPEHHTTPTGVTPASRSPEPSPEPGCATPAALPTVFATSRRLDDNKGRYHKLSTCSAFRKMASDSGIEEMTEEAALGCRLSRCKDCFRQP